MSDNDSLLTNELTDRRSLLHVMTTVGVIGLAGCSGGGDETPTGGSDDQGPEGDDDGSDDERDSTASGGDGGDEETDNSSKTDSNGCPTAPASYERQPIPASVDRDEPAVSIDVPASGPTITRGAGVLSLDYGSGRLTFNVTVFPDSDIETIFSNPDFEVTDEYDLPSGARIWKSTEFDGQESAGVYFPMGGGAVEVNTGLQSQDCLAALRPVHDHMLNSLEVV